MSVSSIKRMFSNIVPCSKKSLQRRCHLEIYNPSRSFSCRRYASGGENLSLWFSPVDNVGRSRAPEHVLFSCSFPFFEITVLNFHFRWLLVNFSPTESCFICFFNKNFPFKQNILKAKSILAMKLNVWFIFLNPDI